MRYLLLTLTLFAFGLRGTAQTKEPLNIILLIGDGMGLTQISAGMYANDNSTILEAFPYVGLSKTYASDNLVTDSAASGTAMATGIKTYNGAIGIDPDSISHQSILETCQKKGYLTALVATSSIVHATPASFYAKVKSRREYQEIALQLSKHSVDIFVGGGKKHFNQRKDNRNLLEEMTSYTIASDYAAFVKSTADKIGYLTYDNEPPKLMEGRTPPLEDVVASTLDKLSAKKAPFFLMVEGSQIDWGGHANELDYVLTEFKEFDRTIAKALAFAKTHKNTLVIVTADHETGGMSINKGDMSENSLEVSFASKSHSATMVPVFSYGPHAESFSGIYENTAIYDKMLKAVNE